MSVNTGIKITTAILWALVLFIASAIIEAMITVFVFKKWGGCPMKEK